MALREGARRRAEFMMPCLPPALQSEWLRAMALGACLLALAGCGDAYPCGPVPPNPAEMLLDPKIKDLFEYLKTRFDVVIVDTAPVGLVSDAMILGEHADCTLYILRQDYTYKKQLGLIDELYTQKKLPKLSVLLNDVKGGTSGYGNYGGYGGYGYGYGYGYGSGYFDESAAKKKTIWQRVQGLFS